MNYFIDTSLDMQAVYEHFLVLRDALSDSQDPYSLSLGLHGKPPRDTFPEYNPALNKPRVLGRTPKGLILNVPMNVSHK